MFWTFLLAILAAMGLLAVVQALFKALSVPVRDSDICHVVRLAGDSPKAEQTVKSCLRLRQDGMWGRLIFVDAGLSAEAQIAVELLLRGQLNAVLCAQEQLEQYIQWERESIGAGTH